MVFPKADSESKKDPGKDQCDGAHGNKSPLKWIELFLAAEAHVWFPFLNDKQTLHDRCADCQACLSKSSPHWRASHFFSDDGCHESSQVYDRHGPCAPRGAGLGMEHKN